MPKLTANQAEILAMLKEDARCFPTVHAQEGHPTPEGDEVDAAHLADLGLITFLRVGRRTHLQLR